MTVTFENCSDRCWWWVVHTLTGNTMSESTYTSESAARKGFKKFAADVAKVAETITSN